MMKMARERWGGAINTDEMGLGKTTQAWDDIVGLSRAENDCFSVICTEKAVMMAWAKEGELSYEEVSGFSMRAALYANTKERDIDRE